MVRSSIPALKDIIVPIPNLEEQERIADLLDNFRKISNKIEQSLLTEIEVKQKQYKYYRDKLLTFKELQV